MPQNNKNKNFKYLTRYQQVQRIIEIRKTLLSQRITVSYQELCDIMYKKHGVLVTVEEINNFRKLIPTNGINERLPSQVTTKTCVQSRRYCSTEYTESRLRGYPSRMNLW